MDPRPDFEHPFRLEQEVVHPTHGRGTVVMVGRLMDKGADIPSCRVQFPHGRERFDGNDLYALEATP